MRALNVLVIGAAAAWATLCAGPAQAVPPGLHVDGNRLVDDAGKTVILRGVNVPSLEWGDGEPNPYSHNPSPKDISRTIKDQVLLALTDWKATLIRLPLNPSYWWSAVNNDGKKYRLLVQDIVTMVADHNAYIILDMHVSDGGQWGQACKQHAMPDVNTQTVLADLAQNPLFKNNPAVFFQLYNEPCRVDAKVWREGGEISEPDDQSGQMCSLKAIGLNDMAKSVRAQGSNNVLIAGTREWCSTMQDLCQPGVLLDDKNVMYDAHVYPGVGRDTATWDAKVGCVADKVPVLVGEFGCATDTDPWGDNNKGWQSDAYMTTLLGWIDQRGFSATAWTFAPLASPILLSDWEGTPSRPHGEAVKAWLTRAR